MEVALSSVSPRQSHGEAMQGQVTKGLHMTPPFKNVLGDTQKGV